MKFPRAAPIGALWFLGILVGTLASPWAQPAPGCIVIGEPRLVSTMCDFKDGHRLFRTRVQTQTEPGCPYSITIEYTDPDTKKVLSAVATRRGVVLETCTAGAQDVRIKPPSASQRPAGNRDLPRIYTDWLPGQDPAKIRELSQQIVEHVLQDAFNKVTQEDIKVGTRIQEALARITELRDRPGSSENLQLRNAEWYLHGLYSAVSNDWSHWAHAKLASFYDDAKKYLQGSDWEPLLRSRPNNPTSPPGGAEWAAAGLRDGKAIKNDESGNRPQGHGLQLKELYR